MKKSLLLNIAIGMALGSAFATAVCKYSHIRMEGEHEQQMRRIERQYWEEMDKCTHRYDSQRHIDFEWDRPK